MSLLAAMAGWAQQAQTALFTLGNPVNADGSPVTSSEKGALPSSPRICYVHWPFNLCADVFARCAFLLGLLNSAADELDIKLTSLGLSIASSASCEYSREECL